MDNPNKSCEPMDIDLSSHSADMDVSYNDSDKIIIKQEKEDAYEYPTNETISFSPVKTKSDSNIKKIHINIPKRSTNTYYLQQLKIFSVILISVIAIIIYHVNIKCSNEINLEELKDVLSTKLYGQSAAIHSIISTLNVTDQSKIIFFYGGTGVGKTLAASLILENVGYSSNVYHYTMPSFINTFPTEFMIGLALCKNSIIIVDDLKRNDMHINGLIKDVITKSEGYKNYITVILIYNCDIDTNAKDFKNQCDDLFSIKLLENYSEIRSLKKLIKFKPLTEEHLMKCIQNEIKYMKIDPHDLHKILKNFNVSVDGCKGVHTKMKVLETAYNLKV